MIIIIQMHICMQFHVNWSMYGVKIAIFASFLTIFGYFLEFLVNFGHNTHLHGMGRNFWQNNFGEFINSLLER
jgi:hypothetical protein